MFRRVLVAFDGTPSAHRAIATAVDLARTNSARLTVITAVNEPVDFLFGSIRSVEFGDMTAPIERRYRAMLDAVVRRASEEVPTVGILGHGSPGPAILDEVGAGRHDVVVIGSRGRGDLCTLLLGSVSRHVLAASPVPVLLVRAARGFPVALGSADRRVQEATPPAAGPAPVRPGAPVGCGRKTRVPADAKGL